MKFPDAGKKGEKTLVMGKRRGERGGGGGFLVLSCFFKPSFLYFNKNFKMYLFLIMSMYVMACVSAGAHRV